MSYQRRKMSKLIFHSYVGEPVKVTDGPFNGFDAVIESVNEEKRKITSNC